MADLDKSIKDLKMSLFDVFTEKLRESNDTERLELCDLMENACKDVHSLIGTIAEMEALKCGRE